MPLSSLKRVSSPFFKICYSTIKKFFISQVHFNLYICFCKYQLKCLFKGVFFAENSICIPWDLHTQHYSKCSRCARCHKVIVMIVRRAYCFHEFIYFKFRLKNAFKATRNYKYGDKVMLLIFSMIALIDQKIITYI